MKRNQVHKAEDVLPSQEMDSLPGWEDIKGWDIDLPAWDLPAMDWDLPPMDWNIEFKDWGDGIPENWLQDLPEFTPADQERADQLFKDL